MFLFLIFVAVVICLCIAPRVTAHPGEKLVNFGTYVKNERKRYEEESIKRNTLL
jgi:hypothetical protein